MKKIVFLILLLSGGWAQAQAPRKFYTRFGGYGHDIAYGVVQTLNGQYAVAGSTSSFGNGNTDVYLALVDSMGWPRWEKSFGGFNNDIGKSIIQLKDSGFVIAGYTNSFGSGGYDMFLVRTDKVGNLIWQKTFGGLDWDFANCVKEVNNGDSLIVCGSTYSYGYGKSDGFIVKTDINGNFMWQKVYGGAEDDEFKSFTLTYNNQYAFAGYTKSMGDVKGDCWLFKTRLNGDSVLGIKYGDSKKQYINDIVEAANSDFVMAGATDIIGKDSTFGYLLSVDNVGAFKYENTFTRSEKYHDFQFTSLTKGNTPTNFVYVYKTYNAPANSKIEPLFMDINGMWPSALTTYGSLEDDEIFDISKCRDRGYVAVGSTKGFNAQLTDVFLIKIDSTLLNSASLVGINESTINDPIDFKIFPTITTDNIFFECPENIKKIQISIKSSIGVELNRIETNSTSLTLKLSEYENGLYFVSIQCQNQNKIFKIIKVN